MDRRCVPCRERWSLRLSRRMATSARSRSRRTPPSRSARSESPSGSFSKPRLARAEEAKQRLHDAAIGAHRDLVDRETSQQMPAAIRLTADLRLELRAYGGVARIDAARPAGLGSDKPHETDVGQNALARILDAHRDDVVALREEFQCALEVRPQEIGYEEDDRLVRKHLAHVFRRAGDIGRPSRRL